MDFEGFSSRSSHTNFGASGETNAFELIWKRTVIITSKNIPLKVGYVSIFRYWDRDRVLKYDQVDSKVIAA